MLRLEALCGAVGACLGLCDLLGALWASGSPLWRCGGLSGLVAPFGMEGGPAQLGDGGQLVDADGSFEHGGRIGPKGGIVISNDNPLGNSFRLRLQAAPLIAMGQRRCALLDHQLVADQGHICAA